MNKRKLYGVGSLLLVPIGLAINLAGAKLTLALSLPLFFDSIGTILTAALGGILPGMIVGFFSNYINSLSDPITVYYAVISVLFALLADFFSRRGVFKSFMRSLLSSLAFAAVGGALGSLMTFALYGMGFGSGISAPYAMALEQATGMGVFFAQLLADVGIDLVDKLFTLMLVYLLLRLIPRRLMAELPLGEIYLDQPGTEPGQQLRCRRSLRRKTGVLIIATSLVLSSLSVAIGYIIYRKAMDQRYIEIATTAVNLMERVVPGERIDYLMENSDSAEYVEIESELASVRSSVSDIEYMYVYVIKPDGCHVVFDLDTDEVPGEQAGTLVPFDDSFEEYLPDLLAGEDIEPVIAHGLYGWLLTVYRPLRDAEGVCQAYAAADIAMSEVLTDRYEFIIRLASLLFGASIIIVALALWYAQRHFVEPLDSLALAAGRFAFESERQRRESSESLRGLKLHTGDEIENLYLAFSKTTEDMANYLQRLDEKTAEAAAKAEFISKLQDNVIISFANMVENRDDSTGHHIKRTAAYVGAMCEAMERDARYSAVMTPAYAENLRRSAPLHDIGKIRVPDAILNKPGRLTPEEFEQIKTHTTAGREILSEVFTGIEGDNYLFDAADMAYSHHERWDGTGYPGGLKGEEIPLSARIMALADVFDALISERCYKRAMSFEEALEEMRSERGTHFDPQLTDIFLGISDRIRQIAEC